MKECLFVRVSSQVPITQIPWGLGNIIGGNFKILKIGEGEILGTS